MVDGKVVRAIRRPGTVDQTEYFGLIQKLPIADKLNEEGSPPSYIFGIASQADKHEVLQKGDIVRFQLAVGRGGTGKRHAINVASAKRYVHSRVESIKGQVSKK